jgi:hypothetical protein
MASSNSQNVTLVASTESQHGRLGGHRWLDGHSFGDRR